MMLAFWNELGRYGPALVSYFQLEESFLSFRQDDAQRPVLPFFQGKVQVEYFLDDGTLTKDKTKGKVKYHAMVFVGMRRVDGKWRLLLQNWWYDMQFVEVSVEYFVSSGAELVWASYKQTKIPDKVPILCSVHAETFTEDRGDIRGMVSDWDGSMSPW